MKGIGAVYEPAGIRFVDLRSGRDMVLVTEERHHHWLCWRHPDGQWVTLRKATEDDLARITARFSYCERCNAWPCVCGASDEGARYVEATHLPAPSPEERADG